MECRYSRNYPAVSPEEQQALKTKKALVAGCGGLGGYLIEYLLRLGVGEITVMDGDQFEVSNLNRQLLSFEGNLGQRKSSAAEERARSVNSQIVFRAVDCLLDESNVDEFVQGQDVVLDALDSIPSRLLLEDACARHQVTLIHGAIQGWNLQVCVVPPGSGCLHLLYNSQVPVNNSSLSFVPALCAGIQVAETLKLLCKRPLSLERKLLTVDARNMDWDIFPL